MALDKPVVAITLYAEASSAAPLERRCVAHVIFNRVRDPRFAKTPAAVCWALAQFSSWNGDRRNRANLMRITFITDDNPVLLDCLAAYDEVKSGAEDPTDGATHYHDRSIPPPAWADPPAVMTLETTRFRFYKNVG